MHYLTTQSLTSCLLCANQELESLTASWSSCMQCAEAVVTPRLYRVYMKGYISINLMAEPPNLDVGASFIISI